MSRPRLAPVAEVLQELLKTIPLPEGELMRVRAAWASAVGRDMALRTRPVAFSEGHLHVEADLPAWARTVESLEPRIVAALRRVVGTPVDRLEVHVRERGKRRVSPRPRPAPPPGPRAWRPEWDAIVASCPTPELADSVRRMLRAYTADG